MAFIGRFGSRNAIGVSGFRCAEGLVECETDDHSIAGAIFAHWEEGPDEAEADRDAFWDFYAADSDKVQTA